MPLQQNLPNLNQTTSTRTRGFALRHLWVQQAPPFPEVRPSQDSPVMSEPNHSRRTRAKMTMELTKHGHQPLSPMRALRKHCLDCCNDSPNEVRHCPCTTCPLWPFRMGKNPWRLPLSTKERERRSEAMRKRHHG